MNRKRNLIIAILIILCLTSTLFVIALIDLRARVEALEDQTLPQGYLRAPDYDSGWVEIDVNESIWFEHNLNTTDVLVHMIGKSEDSTSIHQCHYGGSVDYVNDNHYGTTWDYLNETRIRVYRYRGDNSASSPRRWMSVRIQIWRIQEP